MGCSSGPWARGQAMLSIIFSNFRQGTPLWGPTSGKIGLSADFPLHPRTGPLRGAQAGGVLAKFFAALLGSRVTQPGKRNAQSFGSVSFVTRPWAPPHRGGLHPVGPPLGFGSSIAT